MSDSKNVPNPSQSPAIERAGGLGRTPSRPAPQAMEHVWIDSGPDRLAASLDLPERGGPWPWVLLIHGFTGHRLGRSYHFVQFGRDLASRGVACLRFDQAGCGESTGEQTRYSLQTIQRDIRAIHEWVTRDERFDVSRLGLLGSSQGAIGALMADAEYATAGVALWAPVFDLPLLVQGKVEEAETISAIRALGFAPYRGMRLGPAYFEQMHLVDSNELLTRSDTPILAFHSEKDEVVPVEHFDMLVARCQAIGRSCEAVRLDGSSHDFADEPARYQVLPKTAGWITRHLES